ncbi:MAG: hypothetical protein DRJ38_09180, partial [Thermoprotei archaeon]
RTIRAKIETKRRQFYKEVQKIYHTSWLGWVAVDKEAVKFAEEKSKEFSDFLKKLAEEVEKKGTEVENEELATLYRKLRDKILFRARLKSIKAVQVYLEPEDAKELLSEILNDISDKTEELKKRIEKAEKEKKQKRLRELQKELTLLQLKYEKFSKFAEMI